MNQVLEMSLLLLLVTSLAAPFVGNVIGGLRRSRKKTEEAESSQ